MLRCVRTTRFATFALFVTIACTREDHDTTRDRGLASEQGLPAPTSPTPVAAPTPTPEPQPASEPASEPAPDPALDERKTALANVGKSAFEALQAGDFAALRKLTALDDDSLLRAACPRVALGDPTELEAKFGYCHRTIAWDAVAEAQVFAPKPTGEPAPGCEAGIEDYGRLQLYLHMQDATIWRVDFYGAVGADGKAIGIDGSVSCKQVDEAPKL